MKDDGVILYELVDKFGCSELVYMSTGLPLGSKTETRLRVRPAVIVHHIIHNSLSYTELSSLQNYGIYINYMLISYDNQFSYDS